jgi:Tfp pilus assembly protein PilE
LAGLLKAQEKDVFDVHTLLALLWVRKCLEGALILAALAAIAYALYDRGVHAEQRAEASSQVQASKTEFDRIESTFAQQLSDASATADKYHDLVAVLLQEPPTKANSLRYPIHSFNRTLKVSSADRASDLFSPTSIHRLDSFPQPLNGTPLNGNFTGHAPAPRRIFLQSHNVYYVI